MKDLATVIKTVIEDNSRRTRDEKYSPPPARKVINSEYRFEAFFLLYISCFVFLSIFFCNIVNRKIHFI